MSRTPAFSHVQSNLPSAVFNTADAVWVVNDWRVFLDDSLARWEVFIDATNHLIFVSEATWDGLNGRARVRFEDDFMASYEGSDKRELRTLTDAVYQDSARRRAAAEGTALATPRDRIADLQQRADEAVVAAAGAGGAPSARQLQVFALRHAQLAEDLAALEEDMARLRSAVDLSASALHRAFG